MIRQLLTNKNKTPQELAIVNRSSPIQGDLNVALLLNCVYGRELWFRLLSSVGLQHWVPQGQETLAEWWGQQRASAPSSMRKTFDSALMLVVACACSLWKERNRRVFEGVRLLPHRLYQLVIEEADAWIAAGFAALSVLFAAVGN